MYLQYCKFTCTHTQDKERDPKVGEKSGSFERGNRGDGKSTVVGNG